MQPEDGLEERALDDLQVLVPALVEALEKLAFVSRYLNPPDFARVMEAVGAPDEPLRVARARLEGWPAALADVSQSIGAAADEALAGFEGLRAAPDDPDGMTAVFRALRHLPRAQEALYPLAAALPPVSRYFLDPAVRGDTDLVRRFSQAPADPATGVLHFDNEPGSRGGFSLYVPETYRPDTAWPLVVALHGGSGHGRGFLWTWLRDARSFGAILVAPTAVGRTWALQGPDPDTPNLARILEQVRNRWTLDPQRLLLTGMSDGGTFAYVTGLEPGSPFTHLAPISAAFHPMMAQFADRERLSVLPIRITHGALDWMFPVDMARGAARALAGAGADVTYREIDDLSHTYPREENRGILDWLKG
jgi:phospholipase/carboxylesterase